MRLCRLASWQPFSLPVGAPPLSSGEATPSLLSSCYSGGADPPLPTPGRVPQARPVRAQHPVATGVGSETGTKPGVGEPSFASVLRVEVLSSPLGELSL